MTTIWRTRCKTLHRKYFHPALLSLKSHSELRSSQRQDASTTVKKEEQEQINQSIRRGSRLLLIFVCITLVIL